MKTILGVLAAVMLLGATMTPASAACWGWHCGGGPYHHWHPWHHGW